MRLDKSSYSGGHSTSKERDDLLSSQQSSSTTSLGLSESGDQSTTTANNNSSKNLGSSTCVPPSDSSTNASGKGTNTFTSPVNSLRRPKSAQLKGFRPKPNVPPLNFDRTGLVSRDKELSALKSCYDRLMKGDKKELILVGGQSGSGKSTLIRSVQNEISVEGIFVEGKFDMHTSSEPYSGVAKAFGSICRRVKEAGSEAIADLREDLRKELGDKPGLLVQLIPELQDIMVAEVTSDSSSAGSIDRVDETEGGVDRLRFAFRVLTRVFSALFSPLIIGKCIAVCVPAIDLD